MSVEGTKFQVNYKLADGTLINLYAKDIKDLEDKKEENIIYINENIFPFNLKIISLYHKKYNRDRNGWYLQQLIKLYAGIVIPGILEKYLVTF